MLKKTRLKVLGLSLLALVGVMAVSASAAQAEWLLLKNLTSVESLTLAVEGLAGSILVPALGIEIACSGSVGTFAAVDEGTELSGSGAVTFTGCVETQFEGACTIMGPGAEEIAANGSGVAGMDGEGNVIAELDSGAGAFATVELAGEECPFNELEFPVQGTCHLVVLEPLADTVVKLSHLDDLEFAFGNENPAFIDGPEESDTSLSHVRSLNGTDTWAIHLVNL